MVIHFESIQAKHKETKKEASEAATKKSPSNAVLGDLFFNPSVNVVSAGLASCMNRYFFKVRCCPIGLNVSVQNAGNISMCLNTMIYIWCWAKNVYSICIKK